MIEFGVYGQWGPWGGAFGVDTQNGITGSIFQSVSVGVSADAWTSWSWHGGYEGVSTYGGVGTPIGAPTPISVNGQINLNSGGKFGTIGVNLTGFSDFGEVGFYIEIDPLDLEDPDGGVNGAKQVSVSYGSASIPSNLVAEWNEGKGTTITVGNEFNELDRIAAFAEINGTTQVAHNPDYVILLSLTRQNKHHQTFSHNTAKLRF